MCSTSSAIFSSKNVFTGTLMFGFSLKLKTFNATADVQLLIILPVYVSAPTSWKKKSI
jgi:hypothetical protein